MSGRLLQRSIVYVLLSIAAFVSVFPFLWLVLGATNISPDILSGKSTPGHALFDNIAKLTQQVDLLQLYPHTDHCVTRGLRI
jgi:lactose/L-arabinose transport system permease protein